MEARSLLHNATLDPNELQTVCRAFDEAWEVIKPGPACNPLAVEGYRIRLANAVLAAFRSGLTDVGAIKADALEKIAHFRARFTNRTGAG